MSKYTAIVAYILARLKEPSTLTSIAVIFALVGVNVDAAALQSVFTIATLIFSILGAAVKEAKPL